MFRIALAVLGAAGVAAAFPASASAAEVNTFGCSANALRLTALGGTFEPAVAKQGAVNCVNENRSLLQLPASIPLLGGGVAPAATASAEPGTTKQGASAIGGLANLRVKPLSGLASVQQALNQLVAGVPPIDVLGVGTIDIRPALVDLLGSKLDVLPDLLSVEAATSSATANYDSAGKVQLNGSSKVLGVRLLGNEVPLNGTLERVINLIDTANLDLGGLLPLDEVTVKRNAKRDGALTALRGAEVQRDEASKVRTAVRGAQDNAPRQALIPPALARVKLAANRQERTANRLTQRALLANVSLLNAPLLDAMVGEATVTGQDRPEDVLLRCTKRRLVLTDVVQRGQRVRLYGVSANEFIGKDVSIYFQADGKRVATATVRKDRTFETSAPLPKASIRATNRARYQARIGDERSMNLKLRRRMIVSDTSSSAGNVTFRGTVVQPLTRPARSIVVKRRLSCKQWERVGTIRPNQRSGRFSLRVKAPKVEEGRAVYRLSTRVHKNRTNKKTYPTYTLPLGVNIKN